jgi:hypothetical protein
MKRKAVVMTVLVAGLLALGTMSALAQDKPVRFRDVVY